MNNIEYLKENNIDVDSSIELLGNIETYNDILKDFLSELKERLPKIEEYKNNSDMNNYATLVHAMKGDSKYLGFTKLAKLSEEHQFQSQDGNIDYVNNNYDELKKEVDKVISNYLNNCK